MIVPLFYLQKFDFFNYFPSTGTNKKVSYKPISFNQSPGAGAQRTQAVTPTPFSHDPSAERVQPPRPLSTPITPLSSTHHGYPSDLYDQNDRDTARYSSLTNGHASEPNTNFNGYTIDTGRNKWIFYF